MNQPAQRISAALFTVILLVFTTVNGQQKQPVPSTSMLAIEIVEDEMSGFQSAVLNHPEGGMLETSVRKRIADWKKPEGAAPVTNIRMRSFMEGEAVRIKVSAIFDDSYPADTPGPKYGRSEKQLATYLVREGESVTIEELKNVGVVPMTLRVVRALPRLEEPTAQSPPNLLNKLKSIEIVGFETESSPPNTFRLTLRNMTAKNIVALNYYTERRGAGGGVTFVQGSSQRPLMTAGGTFQTHVNGSNQGGRMTPQGYVSEIPQQATLVVGTVIFEDGTYEGDVEIAVKMEAWKRGRQIQLKRVIAVIENILNASEDDVPTVEKFKSQVSSLRIDVDSSVINEICAKYPNLPEEYSKSNLMSEAMRNMKSAKEMVLRDIEEFEKSGMRASESGDSRQWLMNTKVKYEAMLRRFE